MHTFFKTCHTTSLPACTNVPSIYNVLLEQTLEVLYHITPYQVYFQSSHILTASKPGRHIHGHHLPQQLHWHPSYCTTLPRLQQIRLQRARNPQQAPRLNFASSPFPNTTHSTSESGNILNNPFKASQQRTSPPFSHTPPPAHQQRPQPPLSHPAPHTPQATTMP